MGALRVEGVSRLSDQLEVREPDPAGFVRAAIRGRELRSARVALGLDLGAASRAIMGGLTAVRLCLVELGELAFRLDAGYEMARDKMRAAAEHRDSGRAGRPRR